jgi:hypothetical protein
MMVEIILRQGGVKVAHYAHNVETIVRFGSLLPNLGRVTTLFLFCIQMELGRCLLFFCFPYH